MQPYLAEQSAHVHLVYLILIPSGVPLHLYVLCSSRLYTEPIMHLIFMIPLRIARILTLVCSAHITRIISHVIIFGERGPKWQCSAACKVQCAATTMDDER